MRSTLFLILVLALFSVLGVESQPAPREKTFEEIMQEIIEDLVPLIEGST